MNRIQVRRSINIFYLALAAFLVRDVVEIRGQTTSGKPNIKNWPRITTTEKEMRQYFDENEQELDSIEGTWNTSEYVYIRNTSTGDSFSGGDKNMNCAMPIKSVSPDKKRDNIFFREITKEYRRLSIQTDSEEKIQEILLLFLSKCVDPIDILVKVRSGEYTKEDEIIWNYYLGSSYRKELLQEITKFHNSIYHDGNFQFLVKNPKTQEYLCLDDHGILFLYMDNIEEIMNLINGFIEVNSFSEYITGGRHWHYSFKDAEKYLEELIKQLKLTEG